MVAYDSRPRQIATGTFNEDNYLDLVVVNSGADCIGIFIGYGNGTFTSQTTYSSGHGSKPYSITLGHFDNDTKLDIAVANYGSNSIGVLFGHGDGSFEYPIITSLHSSRPLFIISEDFNNDTLLDIAVANDGTSTVAILLGANNGSFEIDKIYEMGYDSIPYSIATDDFNHDEILDLAIVNYGTSELILILRGRNGSFVMQRYSTGSNSHPISLAIVDFHHDNRLDVAVVNSETGDVAVFLAYASGHFTNVTTHSIGLQFRPHALVISDFNNDRQLDMAISETKSVLLLRGDARDSFSLVMEHPTGHNSDPCSMIVGDFDSDGVPDIAVANNGTNNILLLTSFMIYTTTTQISYPTGINSNPWYVAAADLNEDGYLDIVVPNSLSATVGVFLNLRNGTFTEQQTYDMGEGYMPAFIAIGDVDHDNHSDIVVPLHSANEVRILLGLGDGTFRHGNTCPIGATSRLYTASLGDLNNDDNLDIVVSHYTVANVGIFFGYGNGSFSDMISLLPNGRIHPKYADISDFNNDSFLDIAASDYYQGNISIFLGYGNGSFQDPITVSTEGDRVNAFTVGDVNDDHLLDIVYSDTVYSHVGVLLGLGDGTFRNVTKYMTVGGSEPWYLALGYYNNDALIDIVVATTYDSSINLFMGTGNGMFGAPTRLSTGSGSNPWSVMFADLDNDHQEDIVAGNDVTGNIVIFFVHNYHADFLNESSYPTGSIRGSSSISIADLDHDQQSDDIVVANAGVDSIELLLHFNRGMFSNRTVLSTGRDSHPKAIAVIDFNRDQLVDIAVVNSWDDTLNVFLQLTDGSFDTRNIYSLRYGSAPNSIATGDFNRDGRVDIVIANEGTDNVAVFLAHDYVMFTKDAFDMSIFRPTPIYIATADFNNDGHVDIAVTTFYYDNPAIFLGYGNGTFSKLMTNITWLTLMRRPLAIGDLNNDHYLDIVVANSVNGSISVFLGRGDGSFQSPIIYSTEESFAAYALAIGDFNNDDRLDIVTVGTETNHLRIWFGFGNGSFGSPIMYSMSSGAGPTWIAVADLNNDLFVDIVIANYYSNDIYILLGRGNGSFSDIVTLYTGPNSGPFAVDIGDLNNDGPLDIVVINQKSNSIGTFFGYSNGTFSSQNILVTNPEFDLQSIILRDVNNDTILDILVTDCNRSNSSIGILYGYGDGHFTLPKIDSTGSTTQTRSISTGDFDNDGRIDLAMTLYFRGAIGIMLQRKVDPFGSAKLFSTGNHSRPKSVYVGDLNSDGHLDIVVANSGTDNIGILLGYGAGDFTNQMVYSTGRDSAPSALTIGDFNHDHYLDIAEVNSASDSMGILLGQGNGLFANVSFYSTGLGSSPSSIAVADLNRDNHLDAVVANWGTNKIIVFSGNGDGITFNKKEYPLGYGTRPQSVSIGDINNDHLLDIVAANDGSDYIEILLQTC